MNSSQSETGEDRDGRDPCACGHADEAHDFEGSCDLCPCEQFSLDPSDDWKE